MKKEALGTTNCQAYLWRFVVKEYCRLTAACLGCNKWWLGMLRFLIPVWDCTLHLSRRIGSATAGLCGTKLVLHIQLGCQWRMHSALCNQISVFSFFQHARLGEPALIGIECVMYIDEQNTRVMSADANQFRQGLLYPGKITIYWMLTKTQQ